MVYRFAGQHQFAFDNGGPARWASMSIGDDCIERDALTSAS